MDRITTVTASLETISWFFSWSHWENIQVICEDCIQTWNHRWLETNPLDGFCSGATFLCKFKFAQEKHGWPTVVGRAGIFLLLFLFPQCRMNKLILSYTAVNRVTEETCSILCLLSSVKNVWWCKELRKWVWIKKYWISENIITSSSHLFHHFQIRFCCISES